MYNVYKKRASIHKSYILEELIVVRAGGFNVVLIQHTVQVLHDGVGKSYT